MAEAKQEEETKETQAETEDGPVCRRLSALLADASFKKALGRLLYHIHTESGEELPMQKAEEFLERLRQISFHQVPCVKTVQLEINKHKTSSRTKPVCFVHNKDGEPRQSVVYLDADACADVGNDVDIFLPKLVSAVQFVLGVKVEGLLLYQMLKTPRQAEAILDEAEIRQCAFYSNTFDADTFKAGYFIPMRLHRHLVIDFHEFYEGERVAFQLFDPLIDSKDSEDDRPVYVYAVVLHEINHADLVVAKRYRIDVGQGGGETDVSSTQLYRFIRKTTDETDTPSDEAQEEQTESSKERYDQTLDTSAVLKDLRQILSKAWQICKEKERKNVVKRLLLKWYPDLNIGKESACRRITRAISHYVCLLEEGESLPEDNGSIDDTGDSVDGYVLGHPHFQNLISHKHVKRYPRQKMACSSDLNPQPVEGKRWLRTAQHDLMTARASRGICSQGRNWVCFLCHQAVEKALKGVLYARNADNDCLQAHNLRLLARQVCDGPLQQLAEQIECSMGPHTRMRYPDVLAYPNIPADVYSDGDVDMACDLAGSALERAEWLMTVW